MKRVNLRSTVLLWSCVIFLSTGFVVFVRRSKFTQIIEHDVRLSTLYAESKEIVNENFKVGKPVFMAPVRSVKSESTQSVEMSNKKREELPNKLYERFEKNSKQIEENHNFMKTKMKKLENKLDSWDAKLSVILEKINNMRKPKIARKTIVRNLGEQRQCNDLHLLILISSNISHAQRRSDMRATWADTARYNMFNQSFGLRYDTFFVVGSVEDLHTMRKLREEARLYKDIVHVSSNEDFYDLSRKVMAGFEWAHKYCSYRFLVKGDDDIFINIPNLFQFSLLNENRWDNTYAGALVTDAIPFRNKTHPEYGKYAVTFAEWPYVTYPAYNSGGGFIISHGVVTAIMPHFDWIEPFKIDDAYIGVLVKKSLMLTHSPVLPRPVFRMDHHPRNCTYDANTIIQHQVIGRNCLLALDLGARVSSISIVGSIQQNPAIFYNTTKKLL